MVVDELAIEVRARPSSSEFGILDVAALLSCSRQSGSWGCEVFTGSYALNFLAMRYQTVLPRCLR